MLNINIIAEKEYFLGDELLVRIRLANNAASTVPVWIPVTSSGKLKDEIFSFKYIGQKLEYHGMTVTEQIDPVYISSGEDVEFAVRIAREYLVIEEGLYNLSLERNLALLNTTTTQLSESTTFYVSTNSKPPVSTWMQIASLVRMGHDVNYKMFKSHHVYDANNAQFQILQEIHKKASETLYHIKEQSSKILPNTFSQYYKDLFCGADVNFWPTMHKKYSKMHLFMQNDVVYYFNGKECDSKTYGYTFRADAQKNIYLCFLYDAAPSYPTSNITHDTKMGVIIHEVSHKAVHSRDYFYGIDKCKSSAITCTDDTTRNFDNAPCIQIFAELITSAGLPSKNIPNDEL